MSKDIREMIDKVKNFSEKLNEQVENSDNVWYHGGEKKIKIFTKTPPINRRGNTEGFYFTKNIDYARNHGNEITVVNLKVKNSFILGKTNVSENMIRTYAIELHKENDHLPLESSWIKDKCEDFRDKKYMPYTGLNGLSQQIVYKSGGFDSVIDGHEICVFDSNDIIVLDKTIREYLNEVRYINTKNINKEQPLIDSETLRVFHGFNNFGDVEKVLESGLSGKERARRIYSYESGNNPYGLFVSVDFDVIKRAGFARSGVIIEFSTKISDLEAPVWVDGRSYFVQGEYTKSFKDMDEREQQRLINRQKAGESPYDYISKSDRPELADVIFDNPEKQALYIGDLNPNMIKYVWYNEILHKERRTNGEWVRMSRKDFINKLNIETENDRFLKYLPNDDFNFEEFVGKYFDGDFNNRHLKSYLKYHTNDENTLKSHGFFPKQIKQIMKMRNDGIFDKYLS